MPVSASSRLAQFAHLFQVNPAAMFGNKNSLLASIRRHHHRDPFGNRHPLPSPTTSTSSTSTSTSTSTELSSSSDGDPTFDAEAVPDDRTLVEEGCRRRSLSSRSDAEVDEATSQMLLSDIPEEEGSYLTLKRHRTVPSSRGRLEGRQPASSSERRDNSARLSIICPIPSAESLLAATHRPMPSATVIDASIAPALFTPSPLRPPPAHYKRRRARIMSDEDHDSDPNQASISLLADPEGTLRFPF